jgi:hypothetical protein
VLLSDGDFHPVVGAYFQAHFPYTFGVNLSPIRRFAVSPIRRLAPSPLRRFAVSPRRRLAISAA